MSDTSTDRGVAFGPGETGSTLLRGALAEAVGRFPHVFDGIEIPDEDRFRRDLPDLLVRFEARRAGARERVDIARLLAAYVLARALLRTEEGERPLHDGLDAAPPPPEPVELRGEAAPGWTPEIVWRGETYRGADIARLADRLRREHQLTEAAAAALRWMATERLGAPLDLSEHRFVLLGAAAELAPTPYLLAAGARVLWVDRRPPEGLDASTFAGTLAHVPGVDDLIRAPEAVHAAVAREAAAGPVHLGLYAYAPGKGRELLLTTAMNGIAERLPAEAIASVAMLVSPTTPGEVQPEDRQDRQARREAAPRWQRALARVRLLPEPAHRHGDTEISRSIVPLQGPTYLAAQYLGKMMTAEAWAIDRAPGRVSANVAGITHTRSLEHPLFLAGFLGAPSFGIEIFRPTDTRVLTTLLMLHDLLNPDAPTADPAGEPAARARRLAAQTIHGGVRSVPFEFDHTIRVAAILGLTRQPGLLMRMRG